MKLDTLVKTSDGDDGTPITVVTAHRDDGRTTTLYVYEHTDRPGMLVVDVEGEFDDDGELRVVVNERTAQVFG